MTRTYVPGAHLENPISAETSTEGAAPQVDGWLAGVTPGPIRT